MSWPDDSSMLEEEEAQHPKLQTTDTEPEQGEESEDGARQTDLEEEADPNGQWCLWDWEAVMEGSEGLAYDDPWFDSNTTVMGVDCSQVPALSPHTLKACGLTYTGVANGPFAATGGSNSWHRCHGSAHGGV